MPTNYIKKLSKEGKGSVPKLEGKWDEAKKAAKKQGKGKNYGYITQIFKNMSHAGFVGAALHRLQASIAVEADSFEGFVNSLQYDYERPEGADFVIVNVPPKAMAQKLLSMEWVRNGSHFAKGDHQVELEAYQGKTKLSNIQ